MKRVKTNNPMLADMRTKIDERVAQLRADIEEASVLLAGYQAELKPLLAVLKAMGNDAQSGLVELEPDPPTANETHDGNRSDSFDDELEAEAKEKMAEGTPDTGTPTPKTNGSSSGSSIPPNRWGHYKLAPRHRRFLAKFGVRKSFTHAQIQAWFNSESPGLQTNSVATGINEIVRVLTEKGIIVRGSRIKGEKAWKFVP